MKNTEIESFLRDNGPQVKDDPAFLLEVQRRMRAVDGIKSEVDIQRKYGRQAIVAALLFGLDSGILVALFAYLCPVDIDDVNLIADIRSFVEPWKEYLIFPITICAVALGLMSGREKPSDFVSHKAERENLDR